MPKRQRPRAADAAAATQPSAAGAPASQPLSPHAGSSSAATAALKPGSSSLEMSDMLSAAHNILVVVGAGISTNAGLADFRSPNGLFAMQGLALPVELLFDIEVFEQDPAQFWEFAKTHLYSSMHSVSPTPTHTFIFNLAAKGKLLRCYTQNIDSLEFRAGLVGRQVLQCHGTLGSGRCSKCTFRTSQPAWWTSGEPGTAVPSCPRCTHALRPDVIFYGESLAPSVLKQLAKDCAQCDLLLVIGTSLQVAPMSTVVYEVNRAVPRIWISRDAPPDPAWFDMCILGDCDGAIRGL